MSASEPTTPRWRQPRTWAVAGGLLLAIAVIYGQTLSFPFLNYDDNAYVYECLPVRDGLTADSIAWAFSSGPFGEWYPTAMLSHMLDWQLYGSAAWGHHLTNVLLHAATAIGLFLVLHSMTGEFWPSAAVAAIFAVHPQHVENVAWIAERRDALSGLFFVLSLAAYLGYARRRLSVARYLLVALMLSLGLMAKPTLVTVPPLLLVLDYWPLGRFGGAADLPQSSHAARQTLARLIVEKLPLAVLSLLACAMTLWTHHSDLDAADLTWPVRLAGAPLALAAYLRQFFWPSDLAPFYPFPAGGYAWWRVGCATALLAGVTALAWMRRKPSPYLLVGWLWYVGMLVPLLGIVGVASHAMADRYMYLPGIGLTVAVAWCVARTAIRLAVRPSLLATATALVIAALSIVSWIQTTYWHDDLALWEHALASTEDNYKARYSLAIGLIMAQRPDEAIEQYRLAEQWKRTPYLLNNLAVLLMSRGRLNEAIAEFRQAADLLPNVGQSHANLAIALAAKGDLEEAEPEFLRAIELDPFLLQAHLGLAALYEQEEKTAAALGQYHEVLEIDPNQAEAKAALDRVQHGPPPASRP